MLFRVLPSRRLPRAAAGLLLLLALGGCEDRGWLSPHGNDRALRQGLAEQAAGNYAAAAGSFEAALDGTARTAETRFRLALLLNDKLNDPLGAAHHLRRYLKLAPDGPHAREAKAALERTEITLATSLGGGTLLTRSEALKIKGENTELRKQVTDLQVQLQARISAPATGAPGASVASAAVRAAEAKARASGKTYQVQPGDTPAKIASKVLKNKARYKDILDANYTQLGDPPKKLKPGMTLLIP